MSKVLALYHIVISTKRREKTIPRELSEELYRYIWAEVKRHNSLLIRIGGVSNHIHLLVDLNPAVSLANLVRDIKANSSRWLNNDTRFNLFNGWSDGYFAETVSQSGRQSVIDYINGQADHHRYRPFAEELQELFGYAGLHFDNRDLT